MKLPLVEKDLRVNKIVSLIMAAGGGKVWRKSEGDGDEIRYLCPLLSLWWSSGWFPCILLEGVVMVPRSKPSVALSRQLEDDSWCPAYLLIPVRDSQLLNFARLYFFLFFFLHIVIIVIVVFIKNFWKTALYDSFSTFSLSLSLCNVYSILNSIHRQTNRERN